MTFDKNDAKYAAVDKAKANRLIKWIIEKEAENNSAKKYDDAQMIQRIGKQIQSEAKCL